jgi:integrase
MLKTPPASTPTQAAHTAAETGSDSEAAYEAAATPFEGLRFHDLRHQAITELAEHGASDATVMALAGHMSRHDGALLARADGRDTRSS